MSNDKEMQQIIDKIRKQVQEEQGDIVGEYSKDISQIIMDYVQKNEIKGQKAFLLVDSLVYVAIGLLQSMNKQFDPKYDENKEQIKKIEESAREIINKYPEEPYMSIALGLLRSGLSVFSTSLEHAEVEVLVKKELESDNNGGDDSSV